MWDGYLMFAHRRNGPAVVYRMPELSPRWTCASGWSNRCSTWIKSSQRTSNPFSANGRAGGPATGPRSDPSDGAMIFGASRGGRGFAEIQAMVQRRHTPTRCSGRTEAAQRTERRFHSTDRSSLTDSKAHSPALRL